MSHASETLLDLFITNCSEDATKSGVIVADMSDHLPVYMFCRFHQASKPVRQSHSFVFQEINYKTLNAFRQNICNIDWSSVLLCQDADEAYEKLMRSLKEAYDNSFKYRRVQKSTRIRKPWLNDECLRMIREKDSLYHKFVRTRNPDDFAAFWKYRNYVTKFVRNAKKLYYENLFHELSNRSSLLWREIKKLLHCDVRNSVDLALVVEDRTLRGKELANVFNDYFTSLEKSTHDKSVTNYLGARNAHTAFLQPTDPHEVYTTFMSLKNSKSRDVNGLEIRPVKFVLDLLLPVLTHIFNLSLSTGIFPEKMQHVKVSLIQVR